MNSIKIAAVMQIYSKVCFKFNSKKESCKRNSTLSIVSLKIIKPMTPVLYQMPSN